MGKKIVLNKDELYQKYVVEGLSQKATAAHFHCSIDAVVRNLKDYGIQSHEFGSWCQTDKVVLSEQQKEILNGAMLGDGGLRVAKKGINAQFNYTSKSKQHVEFVGKEFMQYSYSEGIKHVSYYDNRTNKTYDRYTFRTITDKGFTKIYEQWYKDGVKRLPESLILTPTTCLIWYIGDGGLINSNRSQYIKLSTHCFSKEEQERILMPQLSCFEAYLQKADISKLGVPQYCIYIPHRCIKAFLDYIGKCPFGDYEYKWDMKPIMRVSYKDYYKEWEEMYLSGICYSKIAKQYNADPTTVLHHLRKVGIYQEFIGYEQFYAEWEERYLNEEQCTKIAMDYGCSHSTIIQHLKRVGIHQSVR